MSSSAVISLDSTGGLSAGAMVPFTQTWIDTARGHAVTTEATLVGQVLNNGATNWVGYTEGEAYYLLQTSKAGAEQTTLADGQIFYVSQGTPPAGYLATGGLVSGSERDGAAGASVSATANPSTGDAPSETDAGSNPASTTPSSSGDSDSGFGESPSASADGSASSSPNSGYRLTLSATIAVTCALLAVLYL